MKKFRNIILVLIVLLFMLEMYLSKQEVKAEAKTLKPAVALSTFSLYDIASHIAGDTLDIFMILPVGVDAHSFEPTPKLMAKISKSALVVYSGAGLEPWSNGFEYKNKMLNMSEHVTLLKSDKEHEHHEEHAHHEEHEHESCSHGAIDPHYWLDIHNMILATKVITKEFVAILPENKNLYMQNQVKYIEGLKELDKAFKAKLSTCQGGELIVNHNAFSYLAKRYGFAVEALNGLSPEAQPSPKDMIRIIDHVKEHNVSTIFFENFVSDRAMKSIAKDAKVKVDVLQPLGNITEDEMNKKLTYEQIMRINLKKISKALDCK